MRLMTWQAVFGNPYRPGRVRRCCRRRRRCPRCTPSSGRTRRQGLTLVHLSAQRKHSLWHYVGCMILPSLLDRGTRARVTKAAQVELESGRV
jgi:hypothetical protein